MKQAGFSLVEVMLSLALGAILSVTVIQVMVSQTVTNKRNRALASVQENGRFAIIKLQQDILQTGRYDQLSPSLQRAKDTAEEAIFLQHSAVVLPATFSRREALGSMQGVNGANDTLVISKVAQTDCRGYHLGYSHDQEFPVVNEYFIQDHKLKCRGFDLRVLRGQQLATGHNNHNAFTILDNVEAFHVVYGVANHTAGSTQTTSIQYVTADNLTEPHKVVAIRIGLLIRSDNPINVDNAQGFAVLNEALVLPSSSHLYRQFETTIMLRNIHHTLKRHVIS
ncbi:PilW family protein [Glaciecola sp. HTCC2999]|uniref:PilW family protein n=1 Tax=Glaciecola sp. HTCC2999 TaxID=455436 RepID=UPI0000E1151E|nr:PilW family protein [Glaciecola sp. HTCC2999]